MLVRVPFTEIQPATRVALHRYEPYEAAKIDGTHTYLRYWKECWRRGQSFINVEHDVVPWPGALEELWECSALWCAFGYHVNDCFADHERSLFPYLGCVKITSELITQLPDAWTFESVPRWDELDGWFARHARVRGFDVHQHFPPVVNANPVLLDA